MQNIFVVNRPSNVAAHYVSRSLSARLLEPLHYLKDQGAVQFSVGFPGQAAFEFPLNWAFFSKAMDENSLSLARSLKADGVRVLYDIDDHILAYPPYSGARLNAAKIEIIHRFIDLSDIVTAANENIVRLYRSIRPDIKILPNGIYVERYKPSQVPAVRHSNLRIGFVNADFMKIVNFRSEWSRAVDDLRSKYQHLTFAYYGDFSPEQMQLEGWQWLGSVDFDTYRRSLFEPIFDIAFVPLGGEEDPESYEFNLCKNPFKFFEFGAAGIAGIYSDVSVYRNVVTDGTTGLLARSSRHAWTEAASQLIENEDLRKNIVIASYEDVTSKHHIRYVAKTLADYLENHSK